MTTAAAASPAAPKGSDFFFRMPGGFLMKWDLLKGGYLAVSWAGVKFLQRFCEWGVASIGTQKEFVVRFELSLRAVKTAGWLHLELFNPVEARLWILNVAVWKGWNLFFVVNLGARFTGPSQNFRAQKMRQIMVENVKREQAQRLQAQRVQRQVVRQKSGRPYPFKMK